MNCKQFNINAIRSHQLKLSAVGRSGCLGGRVTSSPAVILLIFLNSIDNKDSAGDGVAPLPGSPSSHRYSSHSKTRARMIAAS